jgi:hypothetical protein
MCIKTMLPNNSKNTKSSTSLAPPQPVKNTSNNMPIMDQQQHHPSTSTMLGKKRPHRHNVRFPELDDNIIDNQNNDGVRVNVKRTRVEFLPTLSSEYSAAEKQIRWISSQEKEATSRLASLQAKECRLLDTQREAASAAAAAAAAPHHEANALQQHCPSYRETYNNIFSACYHNMMNPPGQQHQRQKQQQQQHPSRTSLALLAILQADDCTSIRGLEDRTVPLTAMLRRRIRRMVIRQVVLAQQQKRKQQQQQPPQSMNNNNNNNNSCNCSQQHDDDADHLGHLSRSLTQPAVQFAHALGLADAASAMMEYGK